MRVFNSIYLFVVKSTPAIKEFFKSPIIKPLVVGGFILFILIKLFGTSGTSTQKERNPNNYKVQTAFRAAKSEVLKNLKAPSTAKFANEYDSESKYRIGDDDSVIIQSYVDAENSFGAKIRTNYRCSVNKYGEVKDLVTW